MGRSELLQEGVGVEARGVLAGLLLGGAGLAGTWAVARDLGDLQKEHFARELYGALALAAPRGDLRSYTARAVFLTPQVVDLLLIKVPLLQRVGRIPQAVSLLERLRYPTFSHEPVFTLYSSSHAPKIPSGS